MADSETKTRPGRRGRLKWVLAALALLLVAAILVATFWVKGQLSADAVVARFEEKYNARLQIGTFEVTGLTGDTKVTLRNVILAPRDEFADAGTPHSERTPLDNPGVMLVESATLELSASDLLRKQITLSDLNISGLNYYSVIQPDGSHALEPLFDPPATVNGAPNPKFEEQMKRREEAKARRKLTREERLETEPNSFNISELPMPATMKQLHVRNSRVDLKLRKTKTRIAIRDIDLVLSDLDVDAADLKGHNSANVRLAAVIDIENNDRSARYAELKVAADGAIVPFDPVTGYVNPDISYQITLLEGSRIVELPALVQIGREKLAKYGVTLEDLGRNMVLEKDSSMRMGFQEGELRTEQETQIFFSGNVLVIDPRSWWNSGSNEHEIRGSLLVSDVLTKDARGQAEAFLAEKYGLKADLVTTIADVLLAPLTRDDRLFMGFTSTGDFSRPKVRPNIELREAADLIKEKAKGEAMDLLQGLLGE